MSAGNFIGIKRAVLLFAFLAAPVQARIIPAIETAAPIPDAQVLDEAGNSTTIRSMLAAMGGGPVVLLPIYTRCAASCPLQTQKLKQALAGLNLGPVRVLVFSFDPAETTATIEEYRKREAVPENWPMIRASESAVRSFFDFFHYSVLNEKGQLTHPDQIFLLDPSLKWRFTVAGLNWNPQEIGQALGQARSPGILMWIRTHPDAIAWAGLSVIVVGIGFLCIWLIGYKPANRSVVTRS